MPETDTPRLRSFLFFNARLRELFTSGDLDPLDPASLPPESPYHSVTIDEARRSGFDRSVSATAETELEDIQSYLTFLRQGLPDHFRRFVIISDVCLPAQILKCSALGVRLHSSTPRRPGLTI